MLSQVGLFKHSAYLDHVSRKDLDVQWMFQVVELDLRTIFGVCGLDVRGTTREWVGEHSKESHVVAWRSLGWWGVPLVASHEGCRCSFLWIEDELSYDVILSVQSFGCGRRCLLKYLLN